jgi:hypothetical protein
MTMSVASSFFAVLRTRLKTVFKDRIIVKA